MRARGDTEWAELDTRKTELEIQMGRAHGGGQL